MTRIEPMPAGRAPAYLWGEQLAEELTCFEYEARTQPRTKLTMEVVVRASNGRGSVFGTPFKAITTDISPGGMGFLHTTTVPYKFLAITFRQNGQQTFALVEVVRCRSVGNFCEVGAKFIRPLDNVES